MVLEEASSPTEPSASYSETQPTSDIDPYSSSIPDSHNGGSSPYLEIKQPGSPEPLHINLNTLPRPINMFYQPQHSQSLADGIYATCNYASKILQRPLKQEEADAFAWHWAKSMRVASYGTPAGVSVAMIWAWRQKDYRFPLWRPMREGSRFSPDKLGPLRGPTARAAWNVLRFNAYGFVGMAIGQIFFASYALTVHAASRAMDPRLKDFTEALKQRQKDGLTAARAREMAREGIAEAPRQGETPEMARQRKAAVMQQRGGWKKSRESERGQRNADQDGDDMSPTGGSFSEDFMETGGDTGIMSDGQTREQQSRAENATSTFGLSNERTTESRSSTMTDTSSPQPQQPAQISSPRQASSAWERLRQNAMSGNPVSPSNKSPGSSASVQSRSSSTKSDDSFSFSQTEEDRQLARSEAQKEFDARVEREREGRDFNDSGGKQGRW